MSDANLYNIDGLIEKIKRYNSKADFELVKNAFKYGYEFHKDKTLTDGALSFSHSFDLAQTLTDLRMDGDTIAAALLHDVLNESDDVTKEDIQDEFGKEIADLVEGISKINRLSFAQNGEQQVDTFRKMLLSVAQDIRVIILKFVDRIQDLRTIKFRKEKEQKEIANETLNIYAPLAHRFGIHTVKTELEDLSLKVLYEEEYKYIEKKVKTSKELREKYIDEIITPIKKELDRIGLDFQITGRAKHYYSIYRKMNSKGKSIDDMQDLIAVRIITEKIEDCYFALGIVHSIFTPITERFKDYIATPKSNGYQSIHTTVIGPRGKMVEIQIRTAEMHKTSEFGIAAHWRYKEGKVKSDELDKYVAWLRQVIDEENSDPEELFEDLKVTIYADTVFVFTPKGDLIKLTKGSTPLDFAFAIHTNVGIHCIGAKVNNRIVPLKYKLKSGDIVEILTSPNQTPNMDWLNIVNTSKAKSCIKRWFKDLYKEQSTKLGKDMILKELEKGGKKIKAEELDIQLEALLEQFAFKDIDSIYSEVGAGKVSAKSVIDKLDEDKKGEGFVTSTISKVIDKVKRSKKGIKVAGEENLMITFAKCCHPLPGDDIFGYVSRGRGVIVHRKDCKNASNLLADTEKIVQVEWDVEDGRLFAAGIKIIAENRKNLVKEIINEISEEDTNILNANMKVQDSIFTNSIILEVKNINHLNKIIRRLSKIKSVLSVRRLDKRKV